MRGSWLEVLAHYAGGISPKYQSGSGTLELPRRSWTPAEIWGVILLLLFRHRRVVWANPAARILLLFLAIESRAKIGRKHDGARNPAVTVKA